MSNPKGTRSSGNTRNLQQNKSKPIPSTSVCSAPKTQSKLKPGLAYAKKRIAELKQYSISTKYYLPELPRPPPQQSSPPPRRGSKGEPRTALREPFSDSDNDDDHVHDANCTCEQHVSECDPDYDHNNRYRHFRPKLYDFVVEDYDLVKNLVIENEKKFEDNIVIRCPEFAILLDHIIGVIWYFYRDWQYWSVFDIPQLEWAVKFLGGIYSQFTNNPFVDVETIKGHLNELLFINYTEVDKCKLSPCPFVDCGDNDKLHPVELPVSLKSLFSRAPEFTQYLSTTCRCECIIKDTAKLDEYTRTKNKMIAEQVARLREFEMRVSSTQDDSAELAEIVDEIQRHTADLIRVRGEVQRRYR